MAKPHHRFFSLVGKARDQLSLAAEHGKAGRWPEANDCTNAAKGWIELANQYSEAYAIGGAKEQKAAEEIDTDGVDLSQVPMAEPFDQEHESEGGAADDSSMR